MTWEVRRLGRDHVRLIAQIDRSEHVDRLHRVVDGRLASSPLDDDVPPWDRTQIAKHIDTCGGHVEAGATLFGAIGEDDATLGLAVVDPSFEPGLAWLAWFHVSRPHRRQGVATALWSAAADVASAAGATAMYVSATPTGSAVGFYRGRGCVLADPPHPRLFADEPEDIHLTCPLG